MLSGQRVSFERASSYLGRNMAPGVQGATINAIGSSIPELLTAIFFYLLQVMRKDLLEVLAPWWVVRFLTFLLFQVL